MTNVPTKVIIKNAMEAFVCDRLSIIISNGKEQDIFDDKIIEWIINENEKIQTGSQNDIEFKENKVKNNISGYNLYVREMFPSKGDEIYKEKLAPELLKEFAVTWGELNIEDKNDFNVRAKQFEPRPRSRSRSRSRSEIDTPKRIIKDISKINEKVAKKNLTSSSVSKSTRGPTVNQINGEKKTSIKSSTLNLNKIQNPKLNISVPLKDTNVSTTDIKSLLKKIRQQRNLQNKKDSELQNVVVKLPSVKESVKPIKLKKKNNIISDKDIEQQIRDEAVQNYIKSLNKVPIKESGPSANKKLSKKEINKLIPEEIEEVFDNDEKKEQILLDIEEGLYTDGDTAYSDQE